VRTPVEETDETLNIVSFKIDDNFIAHAIEDYAQQTGQISHLHGLKFIRMELDFHGVGIHEVICEVKKGLLN
jgi:hypothetical protein